ncbi:hypothetical protein TNCV_3956301 [Trichonephila clavipes]|nr:hypothetical protein TNCV_3956301 [Trichonephila clavipes]
MNETTKQEKTTQLSSRNEQINSAAGTKQLNSPVGTKKTQLVSRNETTQLCTAVDRLQRLQPPAPPAPPTTACNRLQPPAPPLQQNRLFLPTNVFWSKIIETMSFLINQEFIS